MNLAKFIDHTCLKSNATRSDIEKLSDEALQYHFAAVCIQPVWVKGVAKKLKGSPVKVCSVVGFPLGTNTTSVKRHETEELIKNGAEEIDMVIAIGQLKSKDYSYVLQDISSVVKAAAPCIVKVILETCLLTDEEKKIACQLSLDAGAAFVKTSTGFSRAGATLHDIALMRHAVGPTLGVKASGGITTSTFAQELLHAGATRLGTSRSLDLL